MLDIAVANTDRLVRLINDILDIERMESGKLTLDRQAWDASDLAAQAVAEMRTMADQARVRLSVAAPDCRVLVDRDRVIQTLTNLLSNAIKFSPQGSTVWLTAEPDGDQVRFVVRDEGRGIPADKLEAIFGRFQQVDSSDARQKGGSGLGLAICRSIIQQHGGRIWAQSIPGQGSTFSFTLPSAVGPVPTDGPSGDGVGPLVLVCDDDASVLEVIRATLEERGYRVLTAASGKITLELAARYHPAAILLDVLMPGTSGLDIAAALKQHPETSDIPIVILSVLSPQEADPAPVQVVDWLRKPATEASLFGALERALAGQREGLRVLVVEDDPDLARVLTAIFERHGLETHQAQTASEAIRLSQQLQPQLLVLDLALAEGDGYAVVDWLRQHDRLRQLPLIVYTARDLDGADRSRLRLGETKFFTKGRISPDEFERQLIDLIGQLTHAPAGDLTRATTSALGD
jgi:CheY-like chemotaxis protein/two-component sensor histidine kinase